MASEQKTKARGAKGKRKTAPTPRTCLHGPTRARRLAWCKPFLESLAATGSITQAARDAGIERAATYRLRDLDPEFSAAWDNAIDIAVEALEREARRRAIEGLVRKKFDKGIPIIDPETGQQYTEREFSDQLLIVLLKAHRPEKYGERITVTVLRREAEKLARELGLPNADEVIRMAEQIVNAAQGSSK